MQHPNIYGVLLELADHCNVADVRANAVQLLNCLPTHSQVLDSLRTALQGPQAAQDLESLLCQSQAVVAPTRLLYTLQVCNTGQKLHGIFTVVVVVHQMAELMACSCLETFQLKPQCSVHSWEALLACNGLTARLSLLAEPAQPCTLSSHLCVLTSSVFTPTVFTSSVLTC